MNTDSTEQTDIVPRLYQKRRQKTKHNCCYGQETCSSRHRSWGSVAWLNNNKISFQIVQTIPSSVSPLWSGGGPDYRSEADGKQIPSLAQVHDIEDDSLVHVHILNREIKPESATKPLLVAVREVYVVPELHRTQVPQIRLKIL